MNTCQSNYHSLFNLNLKCMSQCRFQIPFKFNLLYLKFNQPHSNSSNSNTTNNNKLMLTNFREHKVNKKNKKYLKQLMGNHEPIVL